MTVENFVYTNVLPDGTYENAKGAIGVNGGIRLSHQNGGCGMGSCNCSPGHWILIFQPRTHDGTVEGFIMRFKDRVERLEFIEALSVFN